MCSQYEYTQFHKIQELEQFYLATKKYYMEKAFADELIVKLENSKYNLSSGQIDLTMN